MNHKIIDLGILLLYLFALAAYGIYRSRKDTKTKEGYFLGGRKFTWIVIGGSLFATNISSTQFMGEAGLGHKIGVAAANNDLVGGFMLGLSAIFFIPMYLRSRLYTIPEFLEQRFHSSAKIIYGSFFVLQGLLGSPIGYYAGGLGVMSLFGIDPHYLWLVCLVIGLVVGLYAVIGGLASVVYAETVQAVIMIGGATIVTVAGLIKVGGPVALYHAVGASHFQLLLPASDPDMPWTAVITGLTLHSAFFAFCSIPILQRALGAKDLRNAQLGLLFGGFLKLSALFIMAMPGIVAVKLYAGQPGIISDQVYALMLRDLLPAGLSGLVLAGLLAALMSAQESGICAISSIIALDIFPAIKPHATERQSLLVGKISGLCLIAFAVAVAPFAGRFGMIYPLILKISGFMILPAGICFLFGRFVRRINHQGALATLVFGLFANTVYFVATETPFFRAMLPPWLAQAHFYHVLPVLFLVYTALLFGVSLLTPPPSPAKLEVLDRRHPLPGGGAAPTPLMRTFGFWWCVFLACFGTLYLVF